MVQTSLRPWKFALDVGGGGRVWRRSRVSYVTGASNWYWITAGQGLLSLQQVKVEGNVFISSVSSLSFMFIFLSYPSLSSPLLSLLSLFSLSLGDDTTCPTRVDVSLNPNTLNDSSLNHWELMISQVRWQMGIICVCFVFDLVQNNGMLSSVSNKNRLDEAILMSTHNIHLHD